MYVPTTVTGTMPRGSRCRCGRRDEGRTLSAVAWITATSPERSGSRPSTLVGALKGLSTVAVTIVPPPPLDCLSLPSMTRPPGDQRVPCALRDAGHVRGRGRPGARQRPRPKLNWLVNAVLRARARRRRRCRPSSARSSKPAADLVGQHVGAGDHRHAEQDGDRGQRGAQLALGEAAEREADHAASSLRWSRICSCDGCSWSIDDLAVGEEQHRVGDRGRAGVVRDHHDRLAEVVDRAAQQLEHVAARVRVEVAGRLVGEHDGGVGDQRACDRDALLPGRRTARSGGGGAGHRGRRCRSASRATRDRRRRRRSAPAGRCSARRSGPAAGCSSGR